MSIKQRIILFYKAQKYDIIKYAIYFSVIVLFIFTKGCFGIKKEKNRLFKNHEGIDTRYDYVVPAE